MSVKQSPWHIFHIRNRTPFYVDMYSQGFAYGTLRILDFDYHFKMTHVNGQVMMRRSVFERQRRMVRVRLKNDPLFLEKVIHRHYALYAKTLKRLRAIRRLNYAKRSNAELARTMHEYIATLGNHWAPSVVPLYVEQDLTDWISDHLEQHVKPIHAPEVFQVFMTPLREGLVGREYRSLLAAAIAPKSKREKMLKKHRDRFAWTTNQLYTHTFVSLAQYRRRMNVLAKRDPKKLLREYVQERTEHVRAYRYWLRRLNPDRRIRISIDSLNEAIFYRSWRSEKAYESGWIIAPFLDAVAKRLVITVKQLVYCRAGEIETWLRKGERVSKKLITARQEAFVYLPTKPGTILIGKDVKRWERKIATTIPKVSEVKGMVAYFGTVKGIARIVMNAADLKKVKKGDILVTPSTTPLHVPILGKVSAIVAEEGGVLSHASVIAREMKIPCIIGTKIATKVLKDGDLVEVDAERGVIKKLIKK